MKKNKSIKLITFFAILIFVSCINERDYHSYNSEFIEINLDELPVIDTLSLSKIFDNATFIALSDSILIGKINKIEVYNNNFFVLDGVSSSVVVFDEKGNYLKKIGSKGMGPGEMISAFDMTIDRDNNYIYISDIHTRKINKYNIEDGKFQSSIPLPYTIPLYSYISYTNDTIYLTQCDPSKNELEHLFMIYPLNENNPHSIIPTSYNKGWDNVIANYDGTFLSKSDGTILLSHLFMDTIYDYSHNNLKPYIVLNANKKSTFITNDIADIDINENPMDFNKIFSYNKYRDVHHFIDTHEYIFFRMFKGHQIQNILYSKKLKSAEKIDLIYDDILFEYMNFEHVNKAFISSSYGGIDNGSLMYYVSLVNIKYIINMSDQIKDQAFLNYINSIKDTDNFNGLILFYNL